METAPPVPIQWIPEDDFLLKNAVEAGASLEALAKGAVQFSRRFTFPELRDRWHSLLYDPDISSRASTSIFELEISGFNPSSKINRPSSDNTYPGNKEVPQKRKLESIRKKYYAMRKKYRTEFFNNSDLGFLEPNLGNNHPLGLQEDDLDILRHAFPETVRDIAMNSFEDNRKNGIMGNSILEVHIKNRETPLSLQNSSSINENPHDDSCFHHFLPAPDDIFPHVTDDPDLLLNLSNDDEILLLTDVDEKHAENKSSPDIDIINNNNINSVLEDSSKDGNQENDVPEVQHEPKPKPKPVPVLISEEATGTSAQVTAEVSGDKIICTLNTEDTEIPCNDDIFLLIHPSTSFGSSATQTNTTVSIMVGVSEKDNEKLLTKANESAKAFGWLSKVGNSDKTKIHDSRPQALAPGFSSKPFGGSGKGRSFYEVPKGSNDRLVEKEVSGVSTKVGEGSATTTEIIRLTEEGSGRLALQESVVESSGSDQEGSQIDDDVPYFSDVEAMILEMDLDPYDQDSHVNKQVPSYQFDDTKRTIIRLEQSADSCLQRAMTSREAFAILYGRHLRHYITKTEVLLGRSTDDVDVDIDLRKEGRANKISRRQAIIKMEADGSFFLKNLGKSSVSVNGNTVSTGQLLNLSPSCLIEIKGMSFVFEINQEYVRKHLGIFCLKNKGKTGKSECSAKDER